MALTFPLQRLDETVPLPHQGHAGDAAYDLFAAHAVTIAPGQRVQVGTGIAVEIPQGYGMFIWDKSGLSHNHGLKTLGGVIDSGYRGEVKVGLVNVGKDPYTIEKHHKVAQFVIQKHEVLEFVETESLSDASRGEGGFGSTGV